MEWLRNKMEPGARRRQKAPFTDLARNRFCDPSDAARSFGLVFLGGLAVRTDPMRDALLQLFLDCLRRRDCAYIQEANLVYRIDLDDRQARRKDRVDLKRRTIFSNDRIYHILLRDISTNRIKAWKYETFSNTRSARLL